MTADLPLWLVIPGFAVAILGGALVQSFVREAIRPRAEYDQWRRDRRQLRHRLRGTIRITGTSKIKTGR